MGRRWVRISTSDQFSYSLVCCLGFICSRHFFCQSLPNLFMIMVESDSGYICFDSVSVSVLS
ncbi:hypothetical protein HanRHA438_Chr07g0295341 [Helianthus annuus]|nr:hypothetical protein HanRHA438_Chr07g0295341 [Helianthus annuus]